jgi:signal transduction histidine kinase
MKSKILVVEDSLTQALESKFLLEAEGFEVMLANNGKDALRILRKDSVDAILSDILMPVMDGFQLCREIRMDPSLQAIPFIMHSANYRSSADREFGMKTGANAYLPKDSTGEQIAIVLREAIEGKYSQVADSELAIAADEHGFSELHRQRLLSRLMEEAAVLEKINAELRESVEFNEQLIRTIPLAIGICDGEGRFLFKNPAMQTLDLHDLSEMPHGKISGDAGDREVRVAGGKTFEIIRLDILYRGQKASLEVFYDVSERTRAEAESCLAEERVRALNSELERRILERTSELEATNRELEAFTSSVSHDLRAPLRALDGFSHDLMEKYSPILDEGGRHKLERIQAAARQMGRLIDDLLGLSRITRVEISRKTVNLSAIAAEISQELEGSSPSRSVTFEIEPELSAKGDLALLKIMMSNLLENAYKYSAGRANAAIHFGASIVEGEKIFFVRDNGVGFDMAYAGKLFQPFQRLHGVQEFSGTGIGLVTVQRIIARHGGRVWPEAEVDGGASFFFTLPD